ncbi:MAG: PD40 domain-containing protein [Bacteroidales bacterium]|nr:PD40 domain-containing protein [Bacteroidales bacterium]
MAQKGTRLLHEPDISDDLVVFVYAGDLFTAPIAGGQASALTTNVGTESRPKFSPDGKYVAFTGEYDGNTDVYVIPSNGGLPLRLTWHPGADMVQGWTPDGKVLFSSSRFNPNRRSQLFTVELDGGYPDQIPIPQMSLADYSPDGRFIAYTPVSNAFASWKRYRGGRTTPIWIIDVKNWSHVEVPHVIASDTYPVWVGEEVYFLSDRNLDMNLFSYNPQTHALNELVGKKGADIKYLSGNNQQVVFTREGYIYRYDPNTGRTVQLVVDVLKDNPNVRQHFKTVSNEIRNSQISPTGKRAVFEAHGEILTVPAEKGDIRNITNTPGVMERYPAWSPDGKFIAYFSDESGEYALHISDQFGAELVKKVKISKPSFFYSMTWSPDSKKIVFTDKRRNIHLYELANDKLKIIDTRSGEPAWSADSKFITYTKRLDNRFGVIWVYSLDTKSKNQVSDGMSDASGPVFDADGKYLFFRASVNSGMSRSGLDMSSNDHPVTFNIYIAVLSKDSKSPFEPQSDEEEIIVEKKKDDAIKVKNDSVSDMHIDFDGLDQRIIALPGRAGSYSGLASVKGGKFFYRSGSNVVKYDFNERKSETFMSGISRFQVSADGKKFLYRAGKNWGISTLKGKPKTTDGKLNLSKFEIMVDPGQEWAQMLREAWRLNRDYFYAPNMHGVDWEANLKRYQAYLPDLACRSDLNYILREMLGELCVGHSYIRGGAPSQVKRVGGGLLGADFAKDQGRYKIKKIYSGLNWNPDLRAPLTEPGVDVSEGEYILAVNGIELSDNTNIFKLFENTAGKQVELLISANTNPAGAKKITVVPISSESSLRNRDWIEGNRKKVEELSGGKLGYVYLPNTGSGGYSYFNRYFFAQSDKEGLVIDERFNGGGQVANYIIEYMNKDLLNYWAPREGPDYETPFAANFGPKVMIINEYAGSGGDWMPFFFRETGVGKLVGKRTWGGLVGIGGTPVLMDGGSVTAPNFGIFSKDGKWIIENEGVSPDYEIEMDPKEVIDGRDPQLEKAVKVVMDELKQKGYKKTPRPKYPVKRR